MRIYVSGPISDMPEFNAPAFDKAALQLRGAGFDVVNPSELDDGEHHQTWEHYMKRDIALLVYCDRVDVLPGWEHSRGATLECLIATMLELPVQTYDSNICVTKFQILSSFLRRLFRV